MDLLCFVVSLYFSKKPKAFHPSETFFVFILQYVIFKIRLYYEVLNVNILDKRYIYKTKDIFLPDFFL